jgi:uncharacterized peroxidase-related enzyme
LSDLRAEIVDLPAADRERLLGALLRDWRTAELSPPDRALCEFAERLTRAPGSTGPADLERLRALGFDDLDLHRAAQVIGYFNYINRVADALGVDLEPEMPPRPVSPPR